MNEREFDGAALGNRIKLLRALRRMSLDEVGQAAGLTKSHVWELEQGRSRNPTVNAVWGLARALTVSPAAILGLDDAMPPVHPLALEIAGMVDRALRDTGKPAFLDALNEIARQRTDLSGDFSMGSRQSDIARAAIAKAEGLPPIHREGER